MDRLKCMIVFSRIVELGSYTAAAAQMHISVSAVSQIISRLENELDVKLLNRSTRNLSLTEAGKIYFQGCQHMLAEVQRVHERLYTFNNKPIGTLHIGSSSTMAQNVLTPVTSVILQKYPELNVNLVTGNPIPDLITDGLDLVVRVGPLQGTPLFSHQIGRMPMVICAAKTYLSRYGIPDHITDLDPLSWLTYSARPYNEFELSCPEGKKMHFSPQGRFITNDTQTLIGWLLAGTGVACVPLMWVMDEINSSELQILFPNYSPTQRPVYAVYTKKNKLPLKVQVCINALTEYFDNMAERYQTFQSL